MAQHEAKPGAAFGHGGGTNGHAEQAGRFQLLLQSQGAGVVAHQERKDRSVARWTRPAGAFQGIAPALGTVEQFDAALGMLLDLLQRCQRRCGQGRCQCSGVAKWAGVLQEPIAQWAIAGQKRSATAEGLAEGAADQTDATPSVAQASTFRPEDAEGMGFIQQQGCLVALAEAG